LFIFLHIEDVRLKFSR